MGRLLEPSPANIRAWDGVGQTDPEGTVMGRRGTEVPARLELWDTLRAPVSPLTSTSQNAVYTERLSHTQKF